LETQFFGSCDYSESDSTPVAVRPGALHSEQQFQDPSSECSFP